MPHLSIAGVPITYIVDNIDVKKTQNHTNTPYVGQDGSKIDFVSSDAKVLSFKNICKEGELNTGSNGLKINQYINLSKKYNKKETDVTSNSVAAIAGKYKITAFDYVENISGDFEITWELTEVVKFNVTKKTFKVWNKKKAHDTAAAKMSSSKLSSSDKKLLKTCNLMNPGYKGECVKNLQHFLQKHGYYTKYRCHGGFDNNTKEALKKLQKANKLKATGKWDAFTLAYFQIKYKYPNDMVSAKDSVVSKTVKKATTKKKKK